MSVSASNHAPDSPFTAPATTNAPAILRRITQEGWSVTTDGERVAVRHPTLTLDPDLRAELLAVKPALIKAIRAEVRWRRDAMARRLGPIPRGAPVPLLLADYHGHHAPGACVSCGIPAPVGLRCAWCTEAASDVIESYTQRAARLEHQDGLSRQEAEAEAARMERGEPAPAPAPAAAPPADPPAKRPKWSITLNGKTFTTKKAATAFMRELVARQVLGEWIMGDDMAACMDLLQHHPEREDKVGCGVTGFTTRIDPEWGNHRQLVLHRVDGSSTDWSWTQCINGPSPRADVRQAFRRAVADQVVAFRDAEVARGAVCPYRGLRLTRGNSHVDHEAPQTFAQILDDFLEAEGVALLDVPITPPADNQLAAELTDDGMRERWQRWHRERARLRLLSTGANLSEARR